MTEHDDPSLWPELNLHAAAVSDIDPEKLRQLVAKWGLLKMIRIGRQATTFKATAVASWGQQLVDDAMAGKVNAQNVGTYGLLKVLAFTKAAADFGTGCVMDFGEEMVQDCITTLS